jgi:ERCC4-type nuclease
MSEAASYVKQQERESRKRAPPARQKQKAKRSKAPKEHKVSIYIDAKEPVLPGLVRAIYPDLSESSFVLGKALPTGDIRVDVDDSPCLLIERKEVNDFVGSLSNNHFREQRARMIEDREKHPRLILMVLMEGNFDSVDWTKRVKINRSYCEQICRELVYKYNIHVVWKQD